MEVKGVFLIDISYADPRELGAQKYFLAKAFESGLKDVMNLHVSKSSQELIEYLKKKGYYRKLVKRESGKDSYFFFRHKEDKETFMNSFFKYVQRNEIHMVSTEYGIFMGYPPKACKYFPMKVQVELEEIDNFLVNYGGMFFASYLETIEDDINWLVKNKPLGSNSFVLIKRNLYGNQNSKLYETTNENWKDSIMKDLEIYKRTN